MTQETLKETKKEKPLVSIEAITYVVIPEELHKELINLAREEEQGKQEKLVQRLKQLLIEKKINRTSLLKFLNRIWLKDKAHVVFPASINSLGLLLSKEADIELKDFRFKLYELSAQRGSNWGAYNFAKTLLYGWGEFEKNFDEALKYADIAIQGNINAARFIKAKILWKNKNYTASIQIYLQYEKLLEKSGQEWINLKKEFVDITDFLLASIETDETHTALKEVSLQAQLLLVLDDVALKNKNHYIMGLTYYYLGDYKQAMLSFINIPKDDVHYQQATPIKKDCYLKTAESILGFKDGVLVETEDLSEVGADCKEEQSDKEKKESDGIKEDQDRTVAAEHPRTVSFFGSITGKISFGKAWKKESTKSFDVVDVPLLNQIKDLWQEMFTLNEKALEAKSEAINKNLRHKKPKLDLLLTGLSESKKELEEEQQALNLYQKKFDETTAESVPKTRRRLRRAKAEARYFDPTKTKASQKIEVMNLYQQILAARFGIPTSIEKEAAATAVDPSPVSTTHSSSPKNLIEKVPEKEEKKTQESKEKGEKNGTIVLDNRNARQIYRAERLFQQTAKQLLDSATVGRYAMKLGIPHDSNKISGSSAIQYKDEGAGPTENWQVDEHSTLVVHAIAPSRQRLGNIFLTEHGDYNKLISYLNEITNSDSENEKRLVEYVIRYARTFTPTTLEELKAINPEATEKMLKQFHAVCLLVTVKEQTQWLSSEDEEYKTGLAVAQSRCLILLREGYLTFSDVFKRGAIFGVFSQVDLLKDFKKVEAAIEKIEEIYMGYIKFNKCKKYAAFFTTHPQHEMVLTRQQARFDLREIYGGEESGSEDEGYETDMSSDGSVQP